MQDYHNVQIGRRTLSEGEHRSLVAANGILPGGVCGGIVIPDENRLVFRNGSGSRFKDMSGNTYIDYALGSGPLLLGHSHPEVTEAICGQAASGTHFCALLNEQAESLAGRLNDILPCAERLRFTLSGSDATFNAIRLARGFTGREKILKFEGAYNGMHDYAQLSTVPSKSTWPVPQPDSEGIPQCVQDLMLTAPFNDIEAVRELLDRHGSELAAVIVEPIQRCLWPLPGYLEELRRLTRQHGVVLIFDEVVTGFRYGLGGAQEHYNVIPDLAAYGKIIGGGLPMGIIAGRADIMEQADPHRRDTGVFVYQNSTMQGYPLGAAAAHAVLDVLSRPGVYEALDAYCAQLQSDVREVLADEGIEGMQVFGEGPMWHMMFSETRPRTWGDMLRSDMKKTARFDSHLIREGVFVLPNQRRFISIKHDDRDLNDTLEAVRRASRAFHAQERSAA